ncbi:STAS domain-containing protein [Kribbella sp. CA-293567]|uniref:STAS domain-containing protein n=1 Tax=Kribbella sp. CA-293567 TaxID=3002436 RepID=UPI0022DD9D03|nr:STAS domain-containing protein [Kribbella sp. CA-293567]WBQ03154.1 STAS domain-containing protein [Kribbella sp. CA-293567]
MSDVLSIRTGDSGSYVTLEVAGDLDLESTPAMTAGLKAVLGPRPVLVDLSRVEFLDSTGLGVLVGAHREAAAEGGALLLVAAGPRLQKIFKITKLHKVFALHDTMEEAVASLASPLEVEGAPVETVVPGFTPEDR